MISENNDFQGIANGNEIKPLKWRERRFSLLIGEFPKTTTFEERLVSTSWVVVFVTTKMIKLAFDGREKS